MEKYINRITQVRNLFLNFINEENIKYHNNNYTEIKLINKLQYLWLNIDNYNCIKTHNIDYFYNILEEQYILNWRLDEYGFEEYNNYYYELIILLLDIILE
ncbi:unknown similar to AMEV126 [Choristoneura rosaceana entomopoxvirus 'L']|uniref:N1R/p28-like protein n=1 Tax=Choristoneura rosaceana entomopoxvirus 'L' TaxID=1293539 RepID=A0ABM9QKK4_9POXV|nr:unknown similar to AMEV126 [Choristoneura rosaceana entomopoxvirus 'L']CCU56045.1 unknown similar to AMEV126 [Choristoneura rosaceana entomopoxvirus 'L']